MDLVPVLVAVWTAKFEKILKNRGIPRNQVTGNQKTRAVRLSPVLKPADCGPEKMISFFPRRCVLLPDLGADRKRSTVHKAHESTPYDWTTGAGPAPALLTIKQYKKRSAFKIGRGGSLGAVLRL